MPKYPYLLMALGVTLALLSSCQQPQQESYDTEWLGETKQKMITNIEEQFQGFSRTMMETSHRYMELYWAGTDQNWEYAEYQREHIAEALEQGLVRRPEHELSAQQFITATLPEMKQAIASYDLPTFMAAFTQLTHTCNTCHQMEDLPFLTVAIPKNR
ncbi:MAG: hypothetical protein ACOCX0_04720, partial [Bacteroidota bacterium]